MKGWGRDDEGEGYCISQGKLCANADNNRLFFVSSHFWPACGWVCLYNVGQYRRVLCIVKCYNAYHTFSLIASLLYCGLFISFILELAREQDINNFLLTSIKRLSIQMKSYGIHAQYNYVAYANQTAGWHIGSSIQYYTSQRWKRVKSERMLDSVYPGFSHGHTMAWCISGNWQEEEFKFEYLRQKPFHLSLANQRKVLAHITETSSNQASQWIWIW